MSTESTGEYILPSTPNDRKRIKDALEEIVVQLIQKSSADGQIKAILDVLKEELEVPPKIAKKLATVLFKEREKGNEFDKLSQEHESFEVAYETLFRTDDSSQDDSDED